MRTGVYRELLRVPHLGVLIGWAVIARLPNGFTALALLLLVRERTGSYAQAGACVAVAAAGAGLVAPITGRLIDRAGQTKTLIGAGLGHGLALGALAAVGYGHGPGWLLPVLSGLIGLATPPVAAALRALCSEACPKVSRRTPPTASRRFPKS